MQHTKGEWYISENNLGTRLKIKSDIHIEGQSVCIVNPTNNEGEDLANAHILKASKDMYEAIECTINDVEHSIEPDLDFLYEVLQKAKGENQ